LFRTQHLHKGKRKGQNLKRSARFISKVEIRGGKGGGKGTDTAKKRGNKNHGTVRLFELGEKAERRDLEES